MRGKVFSFFPLTPTAKARESQVRFERYIWWGRWGIGICAIPLFLLLDDPLLRLSLAGLSGLGLHNGFRLWLITRHPPLAAFHALSLLCFALDVAVCLVALWPFLREGVSPVQLLLAPLFIEAIPRFRFARSAPTPLAFGALTLALIAYELLGLGYHENRGRALLWAGFFLVCGLWAAAFTLRHALPVPPPSPSPPPEPIPIAPPAPSALLPVPLRRRLTPQQGVVLRLLAEGLKRREIADHLHLDIDTVNTHVQAVYRALDVHTRADALIRAGALGLLDAAPIAPADTPQTPNG